MSDAPRPHSRVTVLSIGNALRADDGLGGRAVAELMRRFPPHDHLTYVDGGVMGLELVAHIEGCDSLLVLDAVNARQPPGSVIRLVDDDIPAGIDAKISMHQAGLRDLLATLRLTDRLPSRVVLLGMQPATVEWGTELSETVRAALPRLVEQAADEVRLMLGGA